MRTVTAIAIIGLLATAEPGLACTCFGPFEGLSKWAQITTDEAAYVFVAQVTAVTDTSTPSRGFGTSATVDIQQDLKGHRHFTGISSGFCQNFALKVGDVRVFFVDANGAIKGCSDYRSFASTEKMIVAVRKAIAKHAT